MSISSDSVKRIEYVVDSFNLSVLESFSGKGKIAKKEAYTKRHLIERIFDICHINIKFDERNVITKLGRWVDYEVSNFKQDFIVEVKYYGGGVKEDVEKIEDILSRKKNKWNLGVATNGITWVFIKQDGKEELDIKKDTQKIILLLSGKRELPEFSKKVITNKFYVDYKKILDTLTSGIFYIDSEKERREVAQVIINRFIFLLFLQAKGIIKGKNGEDRNILEDICRGKRFIVMKEVFFDVMSNNEDERRKLGIFDEYDGVPYLNGSLFRKISIEEKYDYRINGKLIGDVIKFLNQWRFVTDNAISKQEVDPEILGFIFEKAMNDRKGTGAYYTPKEITDYISEHTIYPCILDKVNKHFNKNFKKIDEIFTLDKEQLDIVLNDIILKLKICDNACGSGAFLLAVGNVLFNVCKKMSTDSNTKLKKKILRCIYGVDINSRAIEIAMLRMWLWIADDYTSKFCEPLPNIDFNFRCGDSLLGNITFERTVITLENWDVNFDDLKRDFRSIVYAYYSAVGRDAEKLIQDRKNIIEKLCLGLGFNVSNIFHWCIEFFDVFEDGGFDIMVGNPPYGQNSVSKEQKEFLLKSNYVSLGKKLDGKTYNMSAIFIERSYYLLREGGYFGYIVNNSIARVDEFNGIRKFLLNNTYLYHIVDEGKAFSDVTLEMISLFFKKCNVKQYGTIISSKRFCYNSTLNIDLFKRYSRFILYADDVFDYIYNNNKIGVIHSTRGRDIEKSKKMIGEYNVKYLFSGKSVQKYGINESFVEFVDNKYVSGITTIPSWKKEYEDKLLVATKLLDKYRVTIKPNKYVVGNNVVKLTCNDYDKYFLLCVLNSKLMDYIVKRYIVNYSDLTIAFYDSITMFTPLTKGEKIFAIVGRMLLNDRSEKLLKIADFMVYELYFKDKLGTNLINIVECSNDYCNDIKIQKEIQKIKSHPWVQRIEKEMRDEPKIDEWI